MSQRWDFGIGKRLGEYESEIDSIYRLYHIPVLGAFMVFMLWVRVRHRDRFIADDGTVTYIGNDAWYHHRTTNYVVENYPFNMPFDPWTSFDAGTRVGQFGTIFDQIIATAALVIGLGDPSQTTIDLTFFYAPAVFGALGVIPMYFLGKRLGGRFGGIIAALLLAITPGVFLSRSVAGFTDHHVAETLFTATALVFGMVMLSVAQRDRPIYELFVSRDFDVLRESVLWAVAFGFTLAVAMWNWPPAVFLVGLFGVFLFFHLSFEFVRGHSPDHVAIPSAIAMGVAALLMLPVLKTFELTVTDFSILQPLLAVAVGLGALFMAAVARLWDGRELRRIGYPAAVAGVGVVAVGVVALLSPETFDFFVSQVQRVAGLTGTDTARTIGEAQSPDTPAQFFYSSYGLAFYTAIAGVLLLLVGSFRADRPRADQLLVVVFAAAMLLFTLTQIRFDYYLVVGVGAANAYLVNWVFRFVDLDAVRRDVTNVETYQILVVAAVIFLIAGPIFAIGGPMAAADSSATPGEYTQWEESLDWVSEETPEAGAYGSGDDPRLEYFGTYENTEDFEYEDGEYGVLAWWDYGHWITVTGERIPVANPFQQHATESADFLLADDEEEAVEILEEDSGEGEGVQYIMVDYQLGFAGTQKYNAPAAFESRHDVDASDLGVTVFDQQTRRTAFGVHTQRAYESMRVRLYQHHGSAVEPSSVVVRFGQYFPERGVATLPEDGQPVETFNDSDAAREAAEEDPNAIHGGVLGLAGERIEALEQFRLVHAGGPQTPSPFARAIRQEDGESWVKTFERVEGARIEGNANPQSRVRATVEMEIGSTGETFEYVQFAEADEEGNFEMVVPYSTTGYDDYGTDAGYTDVDVRATGPYQFQGSLTVDQETGNITQFRDEAHVTEGQVLGEEPGPVTVELTRDSTQRAQLDPTATDSGGDEQQNQSTAEPSV